MTDQEKLTMLKKELDSLDEVDESFTYFFAAYEDDDSDTEDPIYQILEENKCSRHILEAAYHQLYDKLHPSEPTPAPTPLELRTAESNRISYMIWELEKATKKMKEFMKEHTTTASYRTIYENLLALLIDKERRVVELRHAIDTQF